MEKHLQIAAYVDSGVFCEFSTYNERYHKHRRKTTYDRRDNNEEPASKNSEIGGNVI